MDDLSRLVADLTAAGPAAVATIETVVEATAGNVEGTGKSLVPVDTGATKNSIGWDRIDHDDIVVEVGPTTDYAPHLEYGTVNMQPRPFMGPAVDVHEDGFVAAVTAAGGVVL